MIPPFLALVPRGVWMGLAGASLLALGFCTHQRAANSAIEAARDEARRDADAQWQSAFNKMREASERWKANYETASADLAREIGQRHAETLRRNAAVADNLRLRGPGKAAHCGPRLDPGLSRSADPDGTPAEPDAPGPDLPPADRSIVSWGWLVTRAEEHDALLSEVDTWRTWHRDQKALFEKWKLEMPKPAF